MIANGSFAYELSAITHKHINWFASLCSILIKNWKISVGFSIKQRNNLIQKKKTKNWCIIQFQSDNNALQRNEIAIFVGLWCFFVFIFFLFLLLALCLNCKFHFSSWECFYSVFGVNILGILCELFDFILNEKAIICSAAIFVVANGNAQHCDRFDRLSEFHFAYSFGHFPTTSSVHYKIVHHTIFRAVLGRPNCVLCLSDMQLAFGIPFFFAFYFGDFFFVAAFSVRCSLFGVYIEYSDQNQRNK